MINKIRIRNFQSHKDTTIDFDPESTVIIGQSNNGKSSIFRALVWAIKNKPDGDGMISHGAWDGKKQVRPLIVDVTVNGKVITKERGKDFSGYRVDGTEFTALGRGNVPEPIEKAFNMPDINIQRQMDSPFLLGLTATEKAKLLNSIVNMSDIGEYLSAVESQRRQNMAESKRVEKEIKELHNSLARYRNIDRLQKQIGQYNLLSEKLHEKKQQVEDIEDKVDLYLKFKNRLKQYRGLTKAQDLIDKITLLLRKKEEKEKQVEGLAKTIDLHNRERRILRRTRGIEEAQKALQKVVKLQDKLSVLTKSTNDLHRQCSVYQSSRIVSEKTEKLSDVENLLKRIALLKGKWEEKTDSYTSLEKNINIYQSNSRTLVQVQQMIKEIQEQLPEVCPVCGQPYKGKYNE